MNIALRGVGKRYGRGWVIRDLDEDLQAGSRIAVRGPNGSGKSTLLRILAGSTAPSLGKVGWRTGARDLRPEEVFRHLAWTAPYIDPAGEFDLDETLAFQARFKPWLPGWDAGRVLERTGLGPHRHKALRDFSSGMLQRVKVALSLFADSRLLLLDEPTTNLDEKGAVWFAECLEEAAGDRLVVIASNLGRETTSCDRSIDMEAVRAAAIQRSGSARR